MPSLITYLWVALGGAAGSVARFALASAIGQVYGDRFPWGTILVNVSGCFAIGLIGFGAAPVGRLPVSPDVRQFLMIGICGGYTTFSSFSLQTLTLLRAGDPLGATANVVFSLGACLAASWLGAFAGMGLSRITPN